MQGDFHYYATYAAAYLAGASHEESLAIAYSAQLVDHCTATLLKKIGGPASAATTQLTLELANSGADVFSLQSTTRIWASFHFLPYDLYASIPKRTQMYMRKYRLVCHPNGALLVDTVELARGKGPQACGIAMHILADTWAHRYFAGTPSLVINNATDFYDLLRDEPIKFSHNPVGAEDIGKSRYINTVFQSSESSIMNLGHGRAGHLPDYSFMKYRFLPAWDNYEAVVKDNPSDYYHAFCQMVYAMKCLRGDGADFHVDAYDEEAVAPWRDEIMEILTTRTPSAEAEWKRFGEKLSGQTIEAFSTAKYEQEYISADAKEKPDSFLGRFISAATAQKSMVTSKIFKSKSLLAGYCIDFRDLIKR